MTDNEATEQAERGINRKTIIWRIKNGWGTSRALTEVHERGYNGNK